MYITNDIHDFYHLNRITDDLLKLNIIKMNLSYFSCIVIDLHVFPQLTIQLSSLMNKKHIPNNIKHNDNFHLLDNGYTYEGYHVIKLNYKSCVYFRYYYGIFLHRDNAPAVECFFKFRDHVVIIEESWYQYDKLHRSDGPAIISYKPAYGGTNVIIHREWWQQGKLHRSNGLTIEQ